MFAAHINVRVLVLVACLSLQILQARAAIGSEGGTLFFIDPTHSSIEFTVPFMGIAKVSGSSTSSTGPRNMTRKTRRHRRQGW